MQTALKNAADVPLGIMRCCGEMVEILEEMLEKGSILAVSDVGVGALLCRSAMEGAALNVYINTKLMADEEQRHRLNEEANEMLTAFAPRAAAVYESVLKRVTA